jgi:signal transduction histidine kinase
VAERWRRFDRPRARPLSDSVEQKRPVLVGTRDEWVARYPEMVADMEQAGTEALIVIPLVVRGTPVGALSFGFRAARHFTETDHTFAATLGQQAAQALERAQLFEAEHRARTDAEAANRSKTEFLSAMSHELRTPLNAIAGYVDLLDLGVGGPVNDAQRQYLTRIRKAGEILLGLITDILNFARVESGHLDYRAERVPLRPLLGELEEMMDLQVSGKGLTYRCEPGDRHVAAVGDPERIRQILINLLTNAVKFTEAGGRIQVDAGARDGRAEVRVRDTGQGIPPDRVEDIFEPFVQLGRRDARESQQGVGLGLAISRDMARRMGGDLTVETVPGEGSTFTLGLPLADS